nr:uncharacterized protein LOC129280873 [Lytechinus pictus]
MLSPMLGPGFLACYLSGKHLQTVFYEDYSSSSVDECVGNCYQDGRSYAAISRNLCFCSDDLPDIQESDESHCNSPCSGNANQTCGSRTHYSFYITSNEYCPPLKTPANGQVIRYRLAVGSMASFRCFPSFQLIGPSDIECMGSPNGSSNKPYWNKPVPTCILKTTTWQTVNTSSHSSVTDMDGITITSSSNQSEDESSEGDEETSTEMKTDIPLTTKSILYDILYDVVMKETVIVSEASDA